jgi:hypothetical protein
MFRAQPLPGPGRRLATTAALAMLAFTTATSSTRAGFTVFDAAAANVAGITTTRDAFRAAAGGGTVAGANGSFGGVRREINWDGVPETLSDPNKLPSNFFNTTSPRGVVFSTPGTGFLVSANSGGSTPRFSASRATSRPSARRSYSRP